MNAIASFGGMDAARSRTTDGAPAPNHPRTCRANSAADGATTTSRSRSADRPSAAAAHTSAASRSSTSARRTAQAPANEVSDVSVRAEIGSTNGRGADSPASADDTCDSGAAATTAWALVPLMPNELTPATRRPSAPQWVPTVGTTKGSRSHGINGLATSKCRLAGTTPRSTDRTALMNDATPAAPSRWPMLVFTEPRSNGVSRSPNTEARASASIGSPRAVPVPWASMYPTSAAGVPARARASVMRAAWAGALGTVKPLAGPSWLTAVALMTAWTRSREGSTSPRRRSATSPQPSDRP